MRFHGFVHMWHRGFCTAFISFSSGKSSLPTLDLMWGGRVLPLLLLHSPGARSMHANIIWETCKLTYQRIPEQIREQYNAIVLSLVQILISQATEA